MPCSGPKWCVMADKSRLHMGYMELPIRRQDQEPGAVRRQSRRQGAWREFSYYPGQQEREQEEEALYSGLEEYSDSRSYSDYASPLTEELELPLSPVSQHSLQHCQELDLDPGRRRYSQASISVSVLNIQSLVSLLIISAWLTTYIMTRGKKKRVWYSRLTQVWDHCS